ncbi:hypothetical protein C2857_006707 [Epichloe festucae Fl1]|uniref:Uncharacterized protein n=1 Tax=Epichloe festucae (strain Fl1) TaxID=877507 RepID=A0A7S9PW49_EPIFF|nr:hypothetical protein C2857_006707 [Epichloe festucae Fl1]
MAARATNPPPANLPELVMTAFAKARADGELHYFPTQVTLLSVGSVPFQLRFAPALANKPKGPPPPDNDNDDPSRRQKPVDPFAHPAPSLFVTDLGPSHYLVLNKFAVVPGHFILATRDFKEQAHVLDESDLESTMSCIEAYERARTRARARGNAEGEDDDDGLLFAFFNCGEHSGASQPHRHVQLLPVDGMRDGLEPGLEWSVLADGPGLDEAPFVVFSEAIRLGMPASELHGIYLRLYREACRAVEARGRSGNGSAAAAAAAVEEEEEEEDDDDDDGAPADGPALISYNMALTRNKLVICPRLAQGGPIYGEDGREVGTLALNGTLLAGTALVKNEEEWDALRKKPGALVNVLKRIGLRREGIEDGGL